MQVCNQLEPIEQRLDDGSRVFCWLHGPSERIPPGAGAPLEREAIGVADEA
jgi:peptide/nickel transport system ATP-binding protein